MPQFSDEPLADVRQRLLDGMSGYLREAASDGGGAGPYTQSNIDECAAILASYLDALSSAAAGGQNGIERLIKDTVGRLNDLNDRCDGFLIETDQREDLCQISLVAARRAGLATSADVTEAWREW